MSEPRSREEWGDAYAELRPTYEAFADRVDRLLRQLLEDEAIRYFETFTWSKNVDALVDRMYRRAWAGVPVDDPFAAFGDLAGVTVVTFTTERSEAVCELVERELVVDAARSVTLAAAEVMNTDPGGGARSPVYAYPHLVVSLPDSRRSLAEWKAFDELHAEIRVPTVVQAGWKSIDEDHLPYYGSSSYPEEARGAIQRAVSFLAAADDQLTAYARAMDDARMRYEHAVAQDELEPDLELDAIALSVYEAQSPTVARLVAHAENAGLRHVSDEPVASEAALWLVRRSGLHTLGDLDAFLRSAEPRAAEIFERVRELVAGEEDYVPWATPESLIDWLVLILHRADAETVGLTRYRDSIEKALDILIGNPSE